MKINNELIKGSTDMLVLSLLEEKTMYGYEIIKEMENKSKGVFELKEGTLYPLLHKLEDEGLLQSQWGSGDGKRKRKYYSITPKGKKAIEEKKNEWGVFAEAVKRILEVNLYGFAG
ncbi:PadR family transcriptional regulator [Sporanaerobacter acetigenes]|uniref:PadR family transcriptional regulator n=1 Tax=Sporanaerobacter acetigenes TaxID=165813 RepID=UPI0033201A03